MNLVFFGIQGSGKGTQAKLIASEHGYTIFETGGELRAIAKEDSELGRKVKETIESGNLVSSELVMEIVEDFLIKHKNGKVIFDGIPRSAEQNQMFTELLNKHNVDAVAVNFKLDKEEAVTRLLKRAEIEGRADDNEESIQKRLSIFFEETTPVIDSYREKGMLIEIDASPTIEEVYTSLTKSLETYDS